MIVLYHFKDGKSDKIWGWIKTSFGVLSFWGRTRGTLSFKRHEHLWDAEDQATKKHYKGYKLVTDYRNEIGSDGSWTISPNALALLPEDWKNQLALANLGQTKF